MRHSGDWMTLVDDRVLEYIRENESGSPTEMMREGPIHYSRQYIARRCKTLAEHGLLRHLGNGVYVITEEGAAYLEERYDTQHWRYLDGGDASAGASGDEQAGSASGGGHSGGGGDAGESGVGRNDAREG